MILSGGALVTKRPDIVMWRGNTQTLEGRALDLIGASYAYDALYRNNVWVYTPVNKIAGATARLPLKVYRRTDTGREDASASPYGVLLRQPNKRIPPKAFWFWVRATLDIYGESFLGKVRDRGGRPVELVPLHPAWVKYDDNESRWSYDDGKRRIDDIPRRDLIHFRHYNPSSQRGLSPLEPLRWTLENEYGARQANSALWRNGGRPSVVLEHPQLLSDAAATRIAASWAEVHGGVENWGKAAVLEEGLKANIIPLNVEELQYIEARKLNREESCSVYDVPPPALHILDHATFSNITEQMRSLYRDTMAPKLGQLESVLEFELRDGRFGADVEPDFPDDEYAEFLMDEVLRGSFEARSAAYAAADYMTIAEKRELENLPFIAGTDHIFLNAASLPLSSEGTLVQPEQQAAEQAAPPPPKAIDAGIVRSLMGRLGRAKSLADVDPGLFTAGLNGDTATVVKVLGEAVDAGETLDQFKTRLKQLAALEPTAAPPPVVNIHQAPVTVNLPEQAFTLKMPDQPAPVVNVPAAQVDVHVEPQPVTVNVAQRTVKTIERDDVGRISRVVEEPDA